MNKLIENIPCCAHLTVKRQTETKDGLTHVLVGAVAIKVISESGAIQTIRQTSMYHS